MADVQHYRAEESAGIYSDRWQHALYLLPLLMLLFATVFSPHKPITNGNVQTIMAAEWYRPYLYGGIYLLAVMAIIPRPLAAVRLAARHGLYLVFLLYVIWTANWSTYPGKVVIGWVHYVGIYLVCLAALLTPGIQGRRFVGTILLYATIAVAVTLLLVALFPGRGIMEVGGKLRWVGFTNSANMLGAVMLVAIWGGWAAMYTFRSVSGRIAIGCLLFLSAVCLVYSDSMTSLLLAVITTLVFPFIMRLGSLSRLTVVAVLFVCGVTTGVALLFIYSVSPDIFTLGTVLDNLVYIGRSATFTGRTTLWSIAFQAISERPLLGWGFDSLRSVSDRYVVHASHFHNGYLELLVNGGLLAMAIMAGIIGQASFWLLRHLRRDVIWGTSLALLLLLILLHNLAEASLGRAPTLLWSLLTMTYLLLSLQPEKPTGGDSYEP